MRILFSYTIWTLNEFTVGTVLLNSMSRTFNHVSSCQVLVFWCWYTFGIRQMRQGIPVNHPVWYTDYNVERMQCVTHSWSPLLCMAIRTTSAHLSSVARMGISFRSAAANSSQKPMAETNKQYITNISPNPNKHVCFQCLWIHCQTKTRKNRYIIYAIRKILLERSQSRKIWRAVHVARREREIHADFLIRKTEGKNIWQHSENPSIDGSMHGWNKYFITITCSS